MCIEKHGYWCNLCSTNDQDNPAMAVNFSKNKYYKSEDFKTS